MKVERLIRKSEHSARWLTWEALKLVPKVKFLTLSHVLIMSTCQKAKHCESLNNCNLFILSYNRVLIIMALMHHKI